jgi:putative transposase
MPRAARLVIPGCPHHVTQRGNNRQAVFFTQDDRQEYIRLLGEQADRFGLTIQAYCLMENHVHLVATPATEGTLAQAVGRTNLKYAMYLNRMHGRSGHLWQDRFFSCPLDEGHFWRACVYVERNPVRAGLVPQPWQYAWSSAAAHVDGKDPTGLLDLAAWRSRVADGESWRQRVTLELDEQTILRLRAATFNNRPLGSDTFLAKLEAALGRRLRPRPRGRPKTQATTQGDK